MRTTLTIDDDVAALLKQEIRRTGEPFKQVANRALRSGLTQQTNPVKPKRFVVKPFRIATPEQWAKWDGMSAQEILDDVDGSLAR